MAHTPVKYYRQVTLEQQMVSLWPHNVRTFLRRCHLIRPTFFSAVVCSEIIPSFRTLITGNSSVSDWKESLKSALKFCQLFNQIYKREARAMTLSYTATARMRDAARAEL